MLVFFVVSGVFIYQLIQWANKPVSQEIRIGNVTNDQQIPIGDQPLTTQYFESKIPENFRIQTSAASPAQANLIQVVAYEQTSGGRQVGVRSDTLPAGGITGVGDYNYRAKTPEEYTKYTNPDIPDLKHAFRKNDGTEITVFIAKGSRYASIAVLSKSDPAKVEELLKKVMNNWQWK